MSIGRELLKFSGKVTTGYNLPHTPSRVTGLPGEGGEVVGEALKFLLTSF